MRRSLEKAHIVRATICNTQTACQNAFLNRDICKAWPSRGPFFIFTV